MKKKLQVLRVLAPVAFFGTYFFGGDYIEDFVGAFEGENLGGAFEGVAGIILITALVLIPIVPFVVWVQYQKQRTKKFKQVAEEMGFIFHPKIRDHKADKSFDLRMAVSAFDRFYEGHSPKIRNMLHSVSEQLEVGIFDYQCTIGQGQGSRTDRQALIYFSSPGLDLPLFSLRPQGLFDKVGTVFGSQDINFESDQTGAEFSKKYLLRGKDEQKVRELFTPEVLDFFAGQDGVSTEGRRSRLIFYRDGERLKPEDTPAFLEEGLEVFRLFAPSQPS
jgi:hypothetical protein